MTKCQKYQMFHDGGVIVSREGCGEDGEICGGDADERGTVDQV